MQSNNNNFEELMIDYISGDISEADQQRLSELAAAGWRIVHVTWAQLETDEAAVMDRVARALGRASK